MDDDGDLDLVTCSGSSGGNPGALVWWENDDAQTFQEHLIALGNGNFVGLEVEDADADGDLDLFVVSREGNSASVEVWENMGNLTFLEQVVYQATGDIIFNIRVTDLDNDGDADFLFSEYPCVITWLENQGNMDFTRHVIDHQAPSGYTENMQAADLDGDGHTDVIAAVYGQNNSVWWWENDGMQNFTRQALPSPGGSPRGVDVGDIDGDSDQDIVVAVESINSVVLYVNDGLENFDVQVAGTGLSDAQRVHLCDLDDDTDLDIVAASWYGSRLRWYENDGAYPFVGHSISGSADFSLQTDDLDQDGDQDIVAVSWWDYDLSWWESDLAQTPVTIYVPDDYPLIQDAIAAAHDGDTVIVRAGTYVENLDFLGKAITVRSEQGAGRTIIDGSRKSSVVSFQTDEDAASVLDGFTITNGAGSDGGGVRCSYSSPTIRNNRIRRNSAGGSWPASGGGIFCDRCSPVIENNIIMDNIADEGGGICMFDSSPSIRNISVVGNSSSWKGGGILVHELCYPTFDNCTVAANSTSGEGGGLLTHYDCIVTISNSIFWNNQASGGGPQLALWADSFIDIDYSDVEGGQGAIYVGSGSAVNWGGGMIDADPLFFDPGHNKFFLRQDPCQPGVDNPCVDAGNPASPLIDGTTRTDGAADAGVVDMGFHYRTGSGVPPYDLSLTMNPEPLVAGMYGLFEVVDGTPLDMTYLLLSFNGMGSTYIEPLGVTVELNRPELATRPVRSDTTGYAAWYLLIPPGAAGWNIWFQACQAGAVSNVVATQVE